MRGRDFKNCNFEDLEKAISNLSFPLIILSSCGFWEFWQVKIWEFNWKSLWFNWISQWLVASLQV